MAQSKRVVGYSDDTELRPLKFVEPIPAAGYVLCAATFRERRTLFCAATPFVVHATRAASMFPAAFVHWTMRCVQKRTSTTTFPAENLLRRKVHCWNEDNGCRVVLAASQVAEHFRHECQHHCSCCPTCLAPVLRRDVCAHLKSRCTALVLSVACDTHTETDGDLKSHLVAFEQKIEKRVGEVDAKLAQLSLESVSQSDKLIELLHSNNHLQEALKNQLEAAAGMHKDTLVELCHNITSLKEELKDQHEATSCSQNNRHEELCHDINDLKETLKDQFQEASAKTLDSLDLCIEKSDALETAIGSIMQSVQIDLNTHQRVLTGYDALKQTATEKGFSDSYSQKVYLRRYLMSWGIYFEKDGDKVLLNLELKLHKGIQDEFLEWPFKKGLKLCFIHPETREEREICVKPSKSAGNRKYYCRPAEDRNPGVYFSQGSIEASEIERGGYLQNNQVIVRLEILL